MTRAEMFRTTFLVVVVSFVASCNRSSNGIPQQAAFGGTYVSANRIGLMPTRIEFNGPRNCIVYTNGVAYAEGAVAPGSRASGPGPGGSAEGLCRPAQGGMEFSSGSSFGGGTMYFGTVDADTFSYRRAGQTIYLTRRPASASSALPAVREPAGAGAETPEEPLAGAGLTPSNPDGRQIIVNPVTVGTQTHNLVVPLVNVENRQVSAPGR